MPSSHPPAARAATETDKNSRGDLMTHTHHRQGLRVLAGFLTTTAILASPIALAQQPPLSIRNTIFSTAPSPDDVLGARAGAPASRHQL